ncbi:glycosyltransferase family 4 protein [Chryseobacterium sp. cx-311]|uniref:glycosyltransferase family 4 protein n=1 Tax=Marnyiella aurantia TaxID=2758037 RepID=UPI001AE3F845|nr:glycosyltransferase family 4 protein [Marnyiella aurantia]MBP0612948.1 glycosyltransferase family 4 protein [Marnyiella aurantia]
MKILYLTDQTYLHGGIEKVLSQKANYLADINCDEVLIATHSQRGNKPVYDFSEKIRMVDIKIAYETERSYLHPRNLRKVPKHKAALGRLLRDFQPDVVVSCSYGPDFFFIPYIKRSIPKIKEFHSSRFFRSAISLKEKVLSKLEHWVEAKYHAIVVLNPDENKYYHSENMSIIPNPAEFSDIRADRSVKRIMAAGRIAPVKNFGALIDAFSALAPDFADWELHFWGSDYLDTQKKLQQQINRLGLQQQVSFMGSAADLKKEMQHYSIYAMTSETECFPMVLLEALSVGMPVITWDAPTGPRHIVSNGSDGIITPYRNLDIFAEQLGSLMRDEQLRTRLGKSASDNVRRFGISSVMKQWKELFEDLTIKS